MRIFKRLNIERRITIILVTHSDEVAAYAQRVVRFRDGKVISDEIVDIPSTLTAPDSVGVLQ